MRRARVTKHEFVQSNECEVSVRRWLSDSRINHAEARSWPTGRYVPLCGATCDESYGWRLSSQRANCKRCRRVRDAVKRAGKVAR